MRTLLWSWAGNKVSIRPVNRNHIPRKSSEAETRPEPKTTDYPCIVTRTLHTHIFVHREREGKKSSTLRPISACGGCKQTGNRATQGTVAGGLYCCGVDSYNNRLVPYLPTWHLHPAPPGLWAKHQLTPRWSWKPAISAQHRCVQVLIKRRVRNTDAYCREFVPGYPRCKEPNSCWVFAWAVHSVHVKESRSRYTVLTKMPGQWQQQWKKNGIKVLNWCQVENENSNFHS